MRAAACLLALLQAPPALAGCAVSHAAEAQRRMAVAATGATRAEVRFFPECLSLGVDVRRWRDLRGVTRRAELQLGGDDSSYVVRHFHDVLGRLRLAIVTGGAVSGARLVDRLAFDGAGRTVCSRRSVTAPGYPFLRPWPDSLLLPRPAGAFTTHDHCPVAGWPGDPT